MEGGDRAVLDAKAFLHHLDHRCQAIGGAARRRDQAVPGGVVELVVDPVHHIEGLFAGDHALHRAGHHHPLQPHLGEVGLEGLGCFELAAALEHHLHACLLPGHGGGIAVLGVANRVALHAEAVGGGWGGAHGHRPAAVDRIKAEQVGGGGGVAAGVVDVDQLNAGAAPQGPEDQAADAAKAIDADFHGPRLR